MVYPESVHKDMLRQCDGKTPLPHTKKNLLNVCCHQILNDTSKISSLPKWLFQIFFTYGNYFDGTIVTNSSSSFIKKG